MTVRRRHGPPLAPAPSENTALRRPERELQVRGRLRSHPLPLPRRLLRVLHPAWLIAGLLGAFGPALAEPVTDDPARPALAATPAASIDESALDDWLGDEVVSSRLRHLIDRTHAEGARQPYHRRQPSWIQSVADLQAHDARQQAEEAARADRDRQTVAWLLEDEARRAAAASAADGDTVVALAAEDDPLRPWRRALGVVALFAGLVALGVTWLVRRPRRRRKADAAEAPAASDERPGRRRHRRSHRPQPSAEAPQEPQAHRHGRRESARP